MILNLIKYWSNQFANLPIDEFLEEAVNHFREGIISDELTFHLHHYNQLQDRKYKGFLTDEAYLEEQDKLSKETFKTVQKINSFLLPILPVKAKAGESHGHQYSIRHQDISEWMYIKKGRVDNSIGIRVQGDSMEPEFNEGDLVICKKIFSPPINQDSLMVVVTKENNIFLKKIHVTYKSDEIQMNSINPKYTSFGIDKDDILEFWQVDSKIKA